MKRWKTMRYLALATALAMPFMFGPASRGDEPASGTGLPTAVTTKSAVRVWVDQIGYRPAGKKILIVSSDAKLPERLTLELCDAATSKVVWKLSEHAKALTPFNNGEIDTASWPVDPKKPGKEKYTGDWFEANFDRSSFLAAVCLWRLTGDEGFHKKVNELAKVISPDRELWGAYWVYMHTPKADPQLVEKMKQQIFTAADGAVKRTGDNRGYAAGLGGYGWGSNRAIGESGLACVYAAELSEDAATKEKYLDAAEEFVHYLHGRNPLGWCYLTNMKQFGAEHSCMVMFHSWFGAPDKQNNPEASQYVGEGPGKIGPPPGYVVGGANGGIKAYNNSLNNAPWTWNEPDITYQSPCAGLLGYFAWKVK